MNQKGNKGMKTFKRLASTFIVALAAVIVGITGYNLIKEKPETTQTTEVTETVTSKPSGTSETVAAAKKVLTKSEIEKVTKKKLTVDTVEDIQKELTKSGIWETLGYPKSVAERIANRFAESEQQALSILREIATENDESLKVIVLAESVNIGTTDDEEIETVQSENITKTALGTIKELDVEFNYGRKELEFDWEVEDNNQIDANYENDLTNEHLTGKEAAAFVEKIVAGIDFQKSSKEEVYEAISKKLNLSDKDLNSFKYEVSFTDQSKIENKLSF